MPTTLLAIRQGVARKLYAGNFPDVVSTTVGNSNSRTVLTDTKLGQFEVEDFLRAYILVSAFAKVDSDTNLNEELNATEVGVDVQDGGKFLAGDGIQIDSEIMRVTAVASNTLTVVRGIQGTDAATHSNGTDTYIVGPAVGEAVKVTNFSASSNKFTLAPALSASLISGTEYEIHYHFHPYAINDKANEILGNVRHPIFLPLTLIADGDMETSGTGSWTASGTGGTPTLAKNTTTVLYGRQTLSVTNDGSTTLGYAKSGSVYLPPNTSVLVSAYVYITDGDSAKLTLIDVTDSNAVVETAESDITGWVHFLFTSAVPADCEEIQLWLESPAVSDVTYWGAIQLLPTQQKVYEYPDTLEWSEDFEGVFYFPTGDAIGGDNDDNAYRVLENASQNWSHATVLRDETAVVPFRIQLDKIPITAPLFVRGMIDFTSLSSNTATTSMPKDIAVDLVFADMMDAWALELLNQEKIELAQEKSSKAAQIRYLLGPRMMHFHKPKGKVQGAMR